MNDYVITCCSTCDLTHEQLKEIGVSCVHFHFTLGTQSYPDDFGLSVPFEDFYKRMAAGEATSTAQVNISEYLDMFTPILEEGKDVLHICLSSGLSGTRNSAENAALIAREQFPERKIYIVDSMGASSGYGLLVTEAAKRKTEGMSIDACRDWLEANKLNVNHWFFSTDLSYYVRGGRISKTAGFVGTMLGICPLLNMDGKGCLVPRYKIRTKKRVISEIVKKMEQYAENRTDYSGPCYISCSACFEDAESVAALIRHRFPKLQEDIRIYSIGTTIGSHTGPGTVALFFLGRDRNLPLLDNTTEA